MRIFRVQDKNGFGPYLTTEWLAAKHNADFSLWPPPHLNYDFGRSIKSFEKCGFINEAQLHNWFSDDELKQLSNKGFMPVVVEGKITAMSENQVLFVMEQRQ